MKPEAQLQINTEHISSRNPQSPEKLQNPSIDESLRSYNTDGGSNSTAHINATKELNDRDRQSVAHTTSRCMSNEWTQLQTAINTSSPFSDHSAPGAPTVATARYRGSTDEDISVGYSWIKEEGPANKAHSKGEALYKSNVDKIQDFQALSSFFQKPTYRFII